MINKNATDFVEHIKEKELLGEIAHKEMSPTNRNLSAHSVTNKEVKKAAVLVVLFEENNQWYFPLIERHVYDGNHSGEIGLPGGKIEQFDENDSEAALRETNEELGIASNDIEIVKELTQIYIPPSNFIVTPFVGVLKEKPHYIPDSFEVKEVFNLSIDALTDDNSKQITRINKEHIQNSVPSFKFEENIIWGATACILNELKYLVKNH